MSILDALGADLSGILTLVLGIGSIFAIAEGLHHGLSVRAEDSRKVAHIGSGLLMMALPSLMSLTSVLIVATGFVGALLMSRSLGWLRGIDGVERDTFGTALFPVGVAASAVLTWETPALFQISMVVLALGDGLANVVGVRWGRHPFAVGHHLRSLEGSATMAAVSFVATAVGLSSSGLTSVPMALVAAVCVALLCTAVEAISHLGLDNITAPVAASLLLAHVVDLGSAGMTTLALGAVVVSSVALVALWRKNLTISGSFAVWVVGFTAVTAAGWGWLLAVLLVFVGVNIASKLKRGHKPLEGKGATRDHIQILCNAGLVVPVALWWHMTHAPAAEAAFLGTVAFAGADTLASELGVLSKRAPVMITTLKPVPPGRSGGVSAFGYMAASVGAALPAAGLSLAAATVSPFWMASALVGGLAGCTVDSVLGASVQARYRCATCGKHTEDAHHCDSATVHDGGRRWANNDAVNLIGSVSAGALGLAFATLWS